MAASTTPEVSSTKMRRQADLIGIIAPPPTTMRGAAVHVTLREIHEAGEESVSEDPGDTLDHTAHRRMRHVYEIARNNLKSPVAIKSQGHEELEHWGQWQAVTAFVCFQRKALEEAYDGRFRETISHEELPVIEMFQRIKSVLATSSRHIDCLVGVWAVVKKFVCSQQEVDKQCIGRYDTERTRVTRVTVQVVEDAFVAIKPTSGIGPRKIRPQLESIVLHEHTWSKDSFAGQWQVLGQLQMALLKEPAEGRLLEDPSIALLPLGANMHNNKLVFAVDYGKQHNRPTLCTIRRTHDVTMARVQESSANTL
ncbi:hypothetical protein ISCGN_016036 [Ixodes scapularis]